MAGAGDIPRNRINLGHFSSPRRSIITPSCQECFSHLLAPGDVRHGPVSAREAVRDDLVRARREHLALAAREAQARPEHRRRRVADRA